MDKYDTIIKILQKSPKKRNAIDISILASLLYTIKFFKDRDLSFNDLEYLAKVVTYKFFENDENIIEYNKFGDIFYVILRGSVSVLIPYKLEDENGNIQTHFKDMAVLGPGKSFGELALIVNTRR